MKSLRVGSFFCFAMIAVACMAQLNKPPMAETDTLKPPMVLDRDLYPASANAKADIKAALVRAGKEKKNVLLDFGAVWCLDCHILDNAFHAEGTKELLESNFVVVHVDVGRMDKNVDVANAYGVPLERGIPAIAVLNAKGKLLVSPRSGEFEAARRMKMDAVAAFLNRWKPTRTSKTTSAGRS